MKKLINGIRTALLVAGFILTSSYPAMASPISPIPCSVQNQRADRIDWIKSYRRLYNCTTQQWIGDWIPC